MVNKEKEDIDTLIDGIKEITKQIDDTNELRYAIVKDEIEDIIENKIKDKMYIESELDVLLDILAFRESEEVLQTFKKLCRYYLNIDPQATFDYINFYLEDKKQEEIEEDDLER